MAGTVVPERPLPPPGRKRQPGQPELQGEIADSLRTGIAVEIDQTEPQQGEIGPPEPSRHPRVTTGERRVRSAPPPEEAEASLVPQQARQPEPIPEEELEEVLEEEQPSSSSVRVPTPPRVPDEHYISEARRILDQPQPRRSQKKSQPRQQTNLATRQKLSGEIRSRATAATRCARSLTWKPPGEKQKL